MPTKSICIKGKLVELSAPLVMGIVNVTPDSFFEGSRKQTEEEIVQRCRQIVEEGGAIIDVGAQSTNPHSEWLTAPQEAARLMPALRLIRKEFPDAVLSVDTFYADVARQAVEEYGADIINDVSGGQIDADMFATAAALNVPYILMHMRGVPQTMQQHTDYEHFIQELIYYFSEKKAQLDQLGVNDIIIDPGFGFSKTLNQNYELMAYLKYFNIFDAPVLVGISRKSMISRLLDVSPEESLNGTSVLHTYSLLCGADILRVHDVKEAVECVRIISKIKEFTK